MLAPAWRRLWHLVLAAVVLASLIIQIGLLVGGGQDVNTGRSSATVDLSTRFVRFFSYFTIQSNLLVLAASIGLALDPQRDGGVWRVLRLDALLGIAVTGVVFALLLRHIVQHEGASAWANAGFHYVAPVAALLGWLLLGPRRWIDARTLGLAFVWPIAWLVYTLVRGAVTGWYPYPFLDVDTLGAARVALNCGGILLFSILLAGLLWALDRRLP